ncbi:GIY-YIG nuclease family protein [Izhakiella australiensis]|uniref:GIY-YIG nuclease family protein n=1 Tax=Izhakiella australiensis TaxID=1926881 RepID=UPI00098FCC5D|nr:GIY-YIG nuclease family protein [Izhakiella australiensis]
MTLVALAQQQPAQEPSETQASLTETAWRLYILRTARGVLYTGITTDVTRRFALHQNGKGAKSLRGKGPLEMLFHTAAGDRASASRLEYRVKQLTRQQKLRLVAEQPPCLSDWLRLVKGD